MLQAYARFDFTHVQILCSISAIVTYFHIITIISFVACFCTVPLAVDKIGVPLGLRSRFLNVVLHDLLQGVFYAYYSEN